MKNPDLAMRQGPSLLLFPLEEIKLMDWINKNHARGCPTRRQDIIEGANQLLKRRLGKSVKCPGVTWYYGFVKRNRLALRKPEFNSKASGCLTKSDILSWFDKVFNLISGRDKIGDQDFSEVLKDPNRCYNAEESFFLLNPSMGKVVVLKGTKNVFEVKSGSEKEGITVMACFSADGGVVKQQVFLQMNEFQHQFRILFQYRCI